MNDLLQSQIRDSCKLAVPDGLMELMSDISREVLRSQPEDLYQFIADYCDALLDAREALSIACRICGEICNCSCLPSLDYELSCIGLSQDDVAQAKDIILGHFDKGQVKECSLLIDLATKTTASETQLEELLSAVRRAFQRSLIKRKELQVSFAAPSAEGSESSQEHEFSPQTSSSDFYKPPCSSEASSMTSKETQESQDVYKSSSYYKFLQPSASATTLAGSYVTLPDKIPYSAHESIVDSDAHVAHMLGKAEESILNILGSFIFTDHSRKREDKTDKLVTILHPQRDSETESMEIKPEVIKRIIYHDYYDKRSMYSQDSRFGAIQENLNESSSSGGS